MLNFRNLLTNLNSVLTKLKGKPSMILGDFNARSRAWDGGGSNARGDILLEWMVIRHFSLLNIGRPETCVRFQGSSAVDTSWASRGALEWIVSWQVRPEEESLSDHLYIHIEIQANTSIKKYNHDKNKEIHKYLNEVKNSLNFGWNIRKLNEDILETAVMLESWTYNAPLDLSADRKVQNIERIIGKACALSMPRRKRSDRKKSYWWTEELALLRKDCIKARRRLMSARQKDNCDLVTSCRDKLRKNQRALRRVIRKSKKSAWLEQLRLLNEDPWGLPFKIVTGRIKSSVPSVTETLPADVVEHIVHTLFPGDGRGEMPVRNISWNPQFAVTSSEIGEAVGKIGGIRKAPGPDGIHGRIIRLTVGPLMDLWSECLTACLREGLFPEKWKVAKMVLLKKGGDSSLDPKNYRPICLLNEMAKLLERIIVSRLNNHIDRHGILSPDQFGFRAGRSTVDAILRLRELTQAETGRGRVVVAVSLDISNAFNSIPWCIIVNALIEADFPGYLICIIRSYFSRVKSITLPWEK